MRDALSILEKVLAYSGNSLNEQDILNIFSLESTEEKMNLIKSILDHDVRDVLDRLNHYISSGSDIKRLTDDLLTILKDVLIYNSSRNVSYLELLKEDEVRELAPLIDDDTAIKMIDVLMAAIKDYKNVNSINPLFEITLLKLTAINGEQKEQIQIEKPYTPPVKPVEKVVENKPIETPKPVVQEVQRPVEQPQPVFTQDIKSVDSVMYLKDAEGEDYFEINEDLMINIMVCSKKEIKTELSDGWKNIKKFVSHPEFGEAATLLIDGHPLVASNKIVVLEYQIPKAAEKVNLKTMQLGLQTILNHIFHRKMFVYAVSRSKSIDLQGQYMNLLQIGQLPKAKDIVLEFEGE